MKKSARAMLLMGADGSMQDEELDRRFDVSGKVVVVTGSTHGIGSAIARGFAGAGAHVWVHGRNASQCAQLAQELGGEWVAGDFSDNDTVGQIVAKIRKSTRRVDVLVNNAGMEEIAEVGEISRETLQRTFDVNVVAPVMLVQGLLEELTNAKGASIINVTSIHQQVPYPHNSTYCMSKAALAMFTETAALDLAGRGIRVNNLAPGAIETDINREVIDSIGRESFEEWIPLGRIGVTDELVGICLFLASRASSYVTGSTLIADGGYSRNLVRYVP